MRTTTARLDFFLRIRVELHDLPVLKSHADSPDARAAGNAASQHPITTLDHLLKGASQR